MVKHAQVDQAAVNVTAEKGVLRVAVSDDGSGFDQHGEHPGHLGLSTMAERAEAIGAELAVSSVSGEGTTVVVSLPHDRLDHGKAGPDVR